MEKCAAHNAINTAKNAQFFNKMNHTKRAANYKQAETAT